MNDMPTAERTQSEAQRREQILQAARDVFKEKGYEAATVSQIVRRAGVAQGTFYLYFESKKSVVIELARKPMAEMSQKLSRVLNGTESMEEILRSFVRLGFEVGGENPDLCRLMHMNSEDPEAVREFEDKREVSAQAIAMFERFRANGEMVDMDPKLALSMFKIIMTGAMQLAFATEPRPAPLDEIIKSTESTVIRSFVSKPESI